MKIADKSQHNLLRKFCFQNEALAMILWAKYVTKMTEKRGDFLRP